MESIAFYALWLPIIVSTIVVYLAMMVFNMLLPLHWKDFAPVEDEDGLLEALRSRNVTRGQYYFPFANSREGMASPEWKEKVNRGPVGITLIHRSGTSMTRQLVGQLILTFAIAIAAGYMGTAALGTGAPYLEVFQATGTAAFLGHAGAHFTYAIWYGFGWGATWMRAAEGLIYGLLTAGVFGWLWP